MKQLPNENGANCHSNSLEITKSGMVNWNYIYIERERDIVELRICGNTVIDSVFTPESKKLDIVMFLSLSWPTTPRFIVFLNLLSKNTAICNVFNNMVVKNTAI